MACLLKGVDGQSLQADPLLRNSVMVELARPPKALQARACSEAADLLRVSCWIFARQWQGKSNTSADPGFSDCRSEDVAGRV